MSNQQEEDYKNLLKEPEWTTLSGKDVDLKKLLRWGLENATAHEDTTTTTNTPITTDNPQKQIDTKWLDIIMGKSDTLRMKECMEEILKDKEEEGNKFRALDELELLIEDLDNSKDFVRLNMLDPFLMLLSQSTKEKEKVGILWVLGTMVQNNPVVKKAYQEKNVLQLVLGLFQSCTQNDVKGKCLYCISGLIKHNTPAQLQFGKLQGYKKLYDGVLKPVGNSSSAQLVQKVLFLFYNVMLDDDKNGVKFITAGVDDDHRSLIKTLLGLLEKYSTSPSADASKEEEEEEESEGASICGTSYNILSCLKKEIKLTQQEHDSLRNLLVKSEAKFGHDQFDEATLKSLKEWAYSG